MAIDEPSVIAGVSNSQMNDKAELSIANSSSLKRKRPPVIQIPNALRQISTDCISQGQIDGPVCFTDSGVGVFSLKGKKKFMEDAYKVFYASNGDKVVPKSILRFFGVYDGHGGRKAAEFVAENLHLKILEMLESTSDIKVKEEATKAGYLKTDEEFLKQGLGSGACCVTALIEGSEMVVSNLGDCRAVLCRAGSAEALTTDHRPTREDERRRIQDKGGYVEIHRGTWRVHGTLAVSRSIGDAHLKDWVMAEPDSKVIHLTSDMQYLVLASDGLWEEVSNQEAVDVVMELCTGGEKRLVGSPQETKRAVHHNQSPRPLSKSRRIFNQTDHEICCENERNPSKCRRISIAKKMKIKNRWSSNENEFLVEKHGLLDACKKLADLAVARGSLDDITVMIVDLDYCSS